MYYEGFVKEMLNPSAESIKYWTIKNKEIDDEITIVELKDGGFIADCKSLNLAI